MVWLVTFCLFAYFVGAIPFGKWIASAKGVDILSEGSGNIGATNVWRVLGWRAGTLVFVLDISKGYLPGVVAALVLRERLSGSLRAPEIALFVGSCAVIGHSLSIFLRFRGGKGVATALGVVLATSPDVAGTTFAVFLLVLGISRYVSVASIVAVAAAPTFAWLMGYSAVVVAVYSVLAVFIVWRHRSNIVRLLHGRESRLLGKRQT